MRKAIPMVLIIALGIMVGGSGTKLNARQASIKRSVLLKTEMAGVQGMDGYIVDVEIAPGAQSGRHYHPGHEFGYVLDGEGVLELDGSPPVPLKKGVSTHIDPKVVHNGKNTGTTPLKLVVFYVLERGQPIAIPVT